MTFEEVLHSGSSVFAATVERLETHPDQYGNMIETTAYLADIDRIGGPAKAPDTVTWLGGTWGGLTMGTCMEPDIETGVRYVFVVEQAPAGATLVTPFVGASQGIFKLQPDAATGKLAVASKAKLDYAAFRAQIVAELARPAPAGLKSLPAAAPKPPATAGTLLARVPANTPPTQTVQSTGKTNKIGPTNFCGYHKLPLVMELAPGNPWTNAIDVELMQHYNRYMDIFQWKQPADPAITNTNQINELAGLVPDVLGGAWGFRNLGLTLYWIKANCGEITESDVFGNSNVGWVADAHELLDNANGDDEFDYRSMMNHELGHVWGNQTKTAETYDYFVPTVMHSMYRPVISGVYEDGFGIQPNDASYLRQNYANQTPVKHFTDVGVELYSADNGLFPSRLNNTQPIRIKDPEELTTGLNVLPTVLVVNNSTEVVNDVRVRFYLSRDPIITTADYEWISDVAPMSLAPESVKRLRASFPFPDPPPGPLWLGALVTINGFGNDDYLPNNTAIVGFPIEAMRDDSSDRIGENDTAEDMVGRAPLATPIELPRLRQYDVDRYLVRLGGTDDLIYATATWNRSYGTMRLVLNDERDTYIGESTNEGGIETLRIGDLTPGLYTIAVTGDNKGIVYTLRAATTRVSEPDRDEENDTLATARDIRGLSGVPTSSLGGPYRQADEDNFLVAVRGSNNALRVNLDFVQSYIDIEILNGAGEVLGSDFSGVRSKQLEVTGLAPGDYYVRITGGDEGYDYELTWTEYNASPAQFEEPNNDFGEAYDLREFSSAWTTDRMGYFTQTDRDVFVIRLGAAENALLAYLRPRNSVPDHTLGGLHFDVFNEAQELIGQSTFLDGWQQVDLKEKITPGAQLYISVEGDNSGTEYDLIWYGSTVVTDMWILQ